MVHRDTPFGDGSVTEVHFRAKGSVIIYPMMSLTEIGNQVRNGVDQV